MGRESKKDAVSKKEKSSNKSRVNGKMLVLSIFLNILVVFLIGLFFYFDKEYVIVPNLIGEKSDDAIAKLHEIKLGEVIESEVVSDDSNIGKVLQESYIGKKVKKDTLVLIKVGISHEMVEMIDVVGDDIETAKEKLDDLGLQYKIVTKDGSSYEKIENGKVMSQSIDSGTKVNKGMVVTIVIDNEKEENSGNVSSNETNKPDNTGVVENSDSTSNNSSSENNSTDTNSSQNGNNNSNTNTKPDTNNTKPNTDSGNNSNTQSGSNSGSSSNSNSNNNQQTKPSATWSSWIEQLPSNVTSSKYIIESKTQYSSRKKEKTVSRSSQMSGWTLYDTKELLTYEGVSPHTVKLSDKEYQNFKKRTDIVINNATVTNVIVDVYSCLKISASNAATDGKVAPTADLKCPSGLTLVKEESVHVQGKGYTENMVTKMFNFTYHVSVEKARLKNIVIETWEVDYFETKDQYKAKYYYFYRWGSWSNFQDTVIKSDSDTEVKTRTLYRYKAR